MPYPEETSDKKGMHIIFATAKGKIRKNNIDIFMQARALGYKHILKGAINNDKIFLTFSSTHTEMNERFGGCTFEFIKN